MTISWDDMNSEIHFGKLLYRLLWGETVGKILKNEYVEGKYKEVNC